MLYSGMLPETMVADREARPPSLALSAAAARFGTPVYVSDMAVVAAATARLGGYLRPVLAAPLLAEGQRSARDYLVPAWPWLGGQRGLRW